MSAREEMLTLLALSTGQREKAVDELKRGRCPVFTTRKMEVFVLNNRIRLACVELQLMEHRRVWWS